MAEESLAHVKIDGRTTGQQLFNLIKGGTLGPAHVCSLKRVPNAELVKALRLIRQRNFDGKMGMKGKADLRVLTTRNAREEWLAELIGKRSKHVPSETSVSTRRRAAARSAKNTSPTGSVARRLKAVCNVCHSVFSGRDNLLTHQKNKHGLHGGGKNFACLFCNKKFKSKYNREVHHRTHTGERPHACQRKGCNDRFQQRANIGRHLRKRHDKRCEECNRFFENAVDLPAHYAAEHPGKKCQIPNTNFKCDCGVTKPSAVAIGAHFEECATIIANRRILAAHEDGSLPSPEVGAKTAPAGCREEPASATSPAGCSEDSASATSSQSPRPPPRATSELTSPSSRGRPRSRVSADEAAGVDKSKSRRNYRTLFTRAPLAEAEQAHAMVDGAARKKCDVNVAQAMSFAESEATNLAGNCAEDTPMLPALASHGGVHSAKASPQLSNTQAIHALTSSSASDAANADAKKESRSRASSLPLLCEGASSQFGARNACARSVSFSVGGPPASPQKQNSIFNFAPISNTVGSAGSPNASAFMRTMPIGKTCSASKGDRVASPVLRSTAPSSDVHFPSKGGHAPAPIILSPKYPTKPATKVSNTSPPQTSPQSSNPPALDFAKSYNFLQRLAIAASAITSLPNPSVKLPALPKLPPAEHQNTLENPSVTLPALPKLPPAEHQKTLEFYRSIGSEHLYEALTSLQDGSQASTSHAAAPSSTVNALPNNSFYCSNVPQGNTGLLSQRHSNDASSSSQSQTDTGSAPVSTSATSEAITDFLSRMFPPLQTAAPVLEPQMTTLGATQLFFQGTPSQSLRSSSMFPPAPPSSSLTPNARLCDTSLELGPLQREFSEAQMQHIMSSIESIGQFPHTSSSSCTQMHAGVTSQPGMRTRGSVTSPKHPQIVPRSQYLGTSTSAAELPPLSLMPEVPGRDVDSAWWGSPMLPADDAALFPSLLPRQLPSLLPTQLPPLLPTQSSSSSSSSFTAAGIPRVNLPSDTESTTEDVSPPRFFIDPIGALPSDDAVLF